MKRAVVDPSVLVSAFRGSATAGPGLLVEAWYEERFVLVVSRLLIAELKDVLGREKFAAYAAEGRGDAYVQDFAVNGERRTDPDDPPLGFIDPDDEYLLPWPAPRTWTRSFHWTSASSISRSRE